MNIFKISLIASIFLISCKLTPKEIVGHYVSTTNLKYKLFYNGKFALGSDLDLLDDSTFILKNCGSYNYGYWILKEGKILELFVTHYVNRNESDTVFVEGEILSPYHTFEFIDRKSMITEISKQKMNLGSNDSSKRYFLFYLRNDL